MFSTFRVSVALPLLLASTSLLPANDSPPRLELHSGDRIVTVGNTLAERLQRFGHFETLLHARFPQAKLVVRGLGWSGDELSIRMRSEDFQDHGHELADHKPSVVIAFYGFNESFAGPEGLQKFERDLAGFIRQTTSTSFDGHSPPRLVLVSPIAHENLHGRSLPDGANTNANLQLYVDAMARLAREHDVLFVDLFRPTRRLMSEADKPLTINGIHLSEAGDKRVSEILDAALFGPRQTTSPIDLAALEREVDEKNQQFWYDLRAVNGYYIYGGRKEPFGVVNFPAEFARLRNMIARRDERIWAVAAGHSVPRTIDDSGAGEFVKVETNYTDPIVITSPEEEQSQFVMAEGYEANLFASEVEFPDLQKPVQFEFDGRGRLWVVTMPSYPMYLPGTPVDDKILIFEDTDGDGRADKQTVFADGLYLPTGIELGDGGVYVAQQPNLMFLRDTDGDDRADQREIVLHGFDSADSHHAISAFTWGPGGALYFQEGTFHQTAVETPYGPVRCANAGVFRYEPRSGKFETFVSYPFANPWGHVFDRWGQNFVADASPGANYFGTAFSGQVDFPRKHGSMVKFLKKQWRPTSGCEIVSSRHFPDEAQGMYLLNNCIGFHGVLAYKVEDDGSGFWATPAPPILESKDQNFRPVDLKFGPDGALYVIDWFNPLIGHMQHSIRDPNRDKTHGRIWRITYKDRPLVTPPRIAGAGTADLLDMLKLYEDRTRYRVRRELRSHDTAAVMAALDQWIAALDPSDPNYQHHLLEALWVHQQHDVVDEGLLKRLLRSGDFRARAAATRVLCYWRDRVQNPLALLSAQANDEHPRVRLEAIRATSFFHEPRAMEVALETLIHPQDVYLEYTLKETLDTLEGRAARRPAVAQGGAQTLIRLLKSDRLPAEQLPLVVRLACQRGDAADLAYVFNRLSGEHSLAGQARIEALSGLAAAAKARKIEPQTDVAPLAKLFSETDDETRVAALQLAGAWAATELTPAMVDVALSEATNSNARRAAVEAIVEIGGDPAKSAARRLLEDERAELQALGILALCGVDMAQASQEAAKLLANPQMAEHVDGVLAGFLVRDGGTDVLAQAIAGAPLSADSAKVALRQLYLAGRSDPALSGVLTRAAGIAQQAVDLSPVELQRLSAEALAQGDPRRGELVFRRGDLGCLKCHSVSGAGGEVGPDLSPVGSTSPIDYMITSILNPDLNIKEVYVTRQIVTVDGLVYSGVVVDRDDKRVVLRDANGEMTTIPTADIEADTAGRSLMPKGLSGFITHGEFLDLVRFLSELGKPGPFAVRSQQTIQKWRVLKSTPAELLDKGLHARNIDQYLSAMGPDKWQTAYALVSGELPLDELLAPERPALFLRAEVEVTEAGPVKIELDSTDGVSLWIDEQELPAGDASLRMKPGIHELTFRVEPEKRTQKSLRVVITRPPGSKAGFAAVGGP